METKTKDYIKSMLVGIIVSILMLISSIYITFKSGVSSVVDTVLLSIILLMAMGGLKTKNVALSDIFARASLSTVVTTAVYFATALLFGEQQNLNITILFGIIIMISSVMGILFFSYLLNPEYNLPFWIFLILIPITIISSTSTLIGIAETGFWFSALEDILPIIIVLLTQTSNLTTIIMVITGLTAFEMSGLYYAINTQVARRFDINHKELITFSIVSSIMGAFLCVVLVSLLAKSIEFGGKNYHYLPFKFSV